MRLTTTLSAAKLSANLFTLPPLPHEIPDRPSVLSQRLVKARARLLHIFGTML
jgi:hypothetical protein